MITHLIKVQMDDYRDATMLVDYAEQAKDNGDHDMAEFFAMRAKKRMQDAKETERLIDEWDCEKTHKAYQEYNELQTERLRKKIDKIMWFFFRGVVILRVS